MALAKLDRDILKQLKKLADVFREARDRGANEADTVMYLVRFFEHVLGYDSLKGEITGELQVKEKYCDLALKIDGLVHILVEGKSASVAGLTAKHIDQAETYGSKSGIRWVLLSNGIEWQLYHLTFAENEGITHDLAFTANLLEEVETDPQGLWDKLSVLTRTSVHKDLLEDFWAHKKVLSPASVVRALFSQKTLAELRRELNRTAPARLELQDVFNAVRDALSKEALLSAGEITLRKAKKKKRIVRDVKSAASVAPPSATDTPAVASIPFPGKPTSEDRPASQELPPAAGGTEVG